MYASIRTQTAPFFDVNETLLALAPLRRPELAAAGLAELAGQPA